MQFKSKCCGFTFIEMAIVTALMAASTGAVLAVYTSSKSSVTANEIRSDIDTLDRAVRMTFTDSAPDYRKLSSARMSMSSLLPSTMRAGTTLITSQGSPITLSGFIDRFFIRYPVSGPGVCHDVANSLLSRYRSVTVGGATVTTPQEVHTACGARSTNIISVGDA